MNPAGAWRLTTESRVLELLAARCSFAAPRVLHADAAGWQVRSMVPGTCEPWELYRRTRGDRGLARRIGQALGSILAEQHAAAAPGDVAGWLPRRVPWPEPMAGVLAALPDVVDNSALLRAAELVLGRYETELEGDAADRVLVHGDLGFHNIALVPGTDAVAGVFDYDGAAWADRHQDFRYLVFPDGTDEAELDGALDAYEPLPGVRLDRERIRLGNAACAIGFLAYRQGTPPDVRSCGRTLAEDLAWVRGALRGLDTMAV
jgi:aminoglycoside phosphotransferase (APT) family kinase protein